MSSAQLATVNGIQISPDDVARFFSKITVTDGCWLWAAGTNGHGYGTFSFGHHNIGSHRVAWAMFYGDLDIETRILHRCDNPACVRPSHLFAGTQLDNMRDMSAKGRRATGERHGSAKLTDAQVAEIRLRFNAGGVPQKSLAIEYSVSQSHIHRIVFSKQRATATNR
jgi:hypothetical protein